MIEGNEEASKDELRDDSWKECRPSAAETNDGIEDIPNHGRTQSGQQEEKGRSRKDNDQLRFGKGNLKEQAEHGSKGDEARAPSEGRRVDCHGGQGGIMKKEVQWFRWLRVANYF